MWLFPGPKSSIRQKPSVLSSVGISILLQYGETDVVKGKVVLKNPFLEWKVDPNTNFAKLTSAKKPFLL